MADLQPGADDLLDTSTIATRILHTTDDRHLVRACAKLNLGLRVFPARADGFHDIETWMVPTSWHDTISISVIDEALALQITGRTEGVPTEISKNLAGRAALKLAHAAGIPPRGTITLHKVLPSGGGLGGGSSDAANVLVALNKAWDLHWEESQLIAIAAELGSDVPFFVRGTPSLCTGRGEIMSPLASYQPLFAVLIIPPQGCPTKDVYQAFDAGHRHAAQPKTDWHRLAAADAAELNELLINDLEPGAFFVAPWLADLRKKAAAAAGQKVHMTGSGSTLFTLCASGSAAGEVQARLSRGLAPECFCVPVRILRQRQASSVETPYESDRGTHQA
jgi:4-diphosphocytidyl-2-C-methyl-D-erythritol kinase